MSTRLAISPFSRWSWANERPTQANRQSRAELVTLRSVDGRTWWRERPGNPSFNAQWAGKPAGALDPTTGYLRLNIDGQHHYVHRIVWLHTKGYLPRKDLDHRYGDKTNCAISNLRPATKAAQNNTNRRSPARKIDAPRSAWFNPKTGMFQVNIRPGGGERGQSIYLGAYGLLLPPELVLVLDEAKGLAVFRGAIIDVGKAPSVY